MKHIRLFLSVLILILMFVPVHAQKIDTKVYYRLDVQTIEGPLNLSVFEFQKGKYAPNTKSPSSEAANQLWRFVDVGKGFFRLVNASQPSMSLGLTTDPKSKVDLVLAKTSASLGQHWKLSPLNFDDWDGFRLVSRSKAGKCISLTNEEVPRVALANFERGSDQSWELKKTDIRVDGKTDVGVGGKFDLTSTAFVNGARIPFEHTGAGSNLSPPLAWKGAPAGTKSFTIICTDPDAPSPANPDPNPFVHWFILNIPADTKYLLSGVPRLEQVSTPFGAVQGPNMFGEIGYSGPMPPKGSGKHRYIFTIFAMDRVHALEPLTPEFIKILDSSVLAKAELMGTYEVPASSFQDSRMVLRSSEPLTMVLEMALRAAQLSNVGGFRH